MKTLVLTSSFPRFPGDPAGNFIETLLREMAKDPLTQFEVVVPEDGLTANDWQPDESIRVFPFQYSYPRFTQQLAYGSGILENIRKNPFLVLQIPFFLLSFFSMGLRHAFSADMLHAHWLIPAGILGALISRMTGKRLILTAHGSDLQWFRRNRWAVWMLRFMVHQAEIVTVNSNYGKKILTELLGHDKKHEVKMRNLSMGVPDTDLLSPRSEAVFAENAQSVLYVGRLIPTKGVDLLLEAMAEIPNGCLLIAGDGPERSRLEQLAKQLGVQVRFLGWVSRDQIYQLFQTVLCLVIPSRDETQGFAEGTPLVLLEAMMSGCPVIASAVGGIPEVLDHRQNGILVTPNSSEALRQAVKAVLADCGLQTRLALAGYETVKNYRLGFIANLWRNLYQELFKQERVEAGCHN